MKTGFSLSGNTTQGKPCSGPVLALQCIFKFLREVTIDYTKWENTFFCPCVYLILSKCLLALIFKPYEFSIDVLEVRSHFVNNKTFLYMVQKVTFPPKLNFLNLDWNSEIWLISIVPYYCFPSNYLIDFKAETITYSYLALKPLWLVVSSTATIVYKDKKNSYAWLSTVC